MATTFTWTYPSNFRMASQGGNTNVVTTVRYKCEANDGTNTVSLEGSVSLPAPGTPFVEYNDLTFNIVDGWVKDALGVNGVASVEACLQGQLDSLANPPPTPEMATFPF